MDQHISGFDTNTDDSGQPNRLEQQPETGPHAMAPLKYLAAAACLPGYAHLPDVRTPSEARAMMPHIRIK
jgi:hypothetical protein